MLRLLSIVMVLCLVPSLTRVAFAKDKQEDEPKLSPLGRQLAEPIQKPEQSLDRMQQYLLDRVPEFTIPANLDDWEARAADLRRRVLDEVVYRGVPKSWIDAGPRVEWHDTIETHKGYVIRKLRYEGAPGMWLPALLYEPTELDGKVPAVLNPNGHETSTGKATPYKQLRCINLAKRGMLALSPEWIGCGELNTPAYKHSRLAYLDLCGRSGLSVFYLAMKRALDVLLDHPNADLDRVVMTGLSGGGWQTITFSSLDTRIRAAVPNAGYISLDNRIMHRADIGDLEQNACDLLTVADYTHLTALLAPRPAMLIYNLKDNCCFPAPRAKPSVYDPVLPLYKRLNVSDRFLYHENADPGTHNYEKDNRQALYRFLNRFIVRPGETRNDEDIPSDDEVKTLDELRVGVPEGNAGFRELALQAAADLPRDRWPAGDKSAALKWQKRARSTLKTIMRYKPIAVTSASNVGHATSIPAAPGSGGGSAAAGSLKFTRRVLHTDAGWELPLVEAVFATGAPDHLAIVAADGGRPAAEPAVKKLTDSGARVLVVDLLFFGECKPGPHAPWQFAQMFATVGDRPLGIRAAQFLAVADWAAGAFKPREITLVGVGRSAAVTALVAAGLDPVTDAGPKRIARVETWALPASLKLLIENEVEYREAPGLFCFGLLQHYDVRELIGLTAPRPVALHDLSGPRSVASSGPNVPTQRVARELAPLKPWLARWNAPPPEID